MIWPRPPESARYKTTLRLAIQLPRYFNGLSSWRTAVARRRPSVGARSNTSTGIFVRNRSSIIAHTLENPLTGGGSGPANATLRVTLQDAMVGWLPIWRRALTPRRTPSLIDSIAEARQNDRNAALANPIAIINEPRK